MNYFDFYKSDRKLTGFNFYLVKVFFWMISGLTLSFITSITVSNSFFVVKILFSNYSNVYILSILEVLLVHILSKHIQKLSYLVAAILFMMYSFLNGLTLSVICLLHRIETMYVTFMITALLFAAMAVYGKMTKRDLSPLIGFLVMGLMGLIIAFFINLFFGSKLIDFVVSVIGVFIFSGLTAWNIQKLRNYYYCYGHSEIGNNFAVLGALELYLDFINIFLQLLQKLALRE